MTEWEQAREVLKDFDERAHDLRKYGFSFVTALLAAQSLLVPSLVPGAAASGAINEAVKLGVLIVTLLLIVTLRLFERTYELFRQAAATRAGILEKILDLELTDTITSHYRSGHMPELVTLLYVFFALAVGGIGSFIVPDYTPWLWLAIALTIAGLYGIMLLSLGYKRGPEDWSIDRQECEEGDPVRITLTNLDPENEVSLPELLTVWSVESEMINDRGDPIYRHLEGSHEVVIGPGNTYTWIWDTQGVQAGIYKIFPSQPNYDAQRKLLDQLRGRTVWKFRPATGPPRELWPYPLARKIMVRQKSVACKAEHPK